MLMSDFRVLREPAGPALNFKARQTWRGQSIVHRRDGTDFAAAVTLTHIETTDRSVQNADVLIMRDITEERQLEEQKAKFIANASHELRTPLTNLKTRLYLLHRQPERHTEHIAVIERVTSRMAQLVDDLLDVTRFERGAIRLFRQQVNLQTVILDVVEQQRPEAHRKHIALHPDLSPEPILINADSDRLMQVLVNLVINAINYTMEGGQVAISLRCADGVAIIAIKDTGIGIAPENLNRIFEPFFRASEGTARGTGLGLNIAREIVQLHGGSLSVESQVGAGSTFSVALPLNA
jgi:signal transduction histidine kinase